MTPLVSPQASSNDIDAALGAAHRHWNGIALADFAHGIAQRTLGVTIVDRKVNTGVIIDSVVSDVFHLLRDLRIRTVSHYPSSGGIEAPSLTADQRLGIAEGIARLRAALSEQGFRLS